MVKYLICIYFLTVGCLSCLGQGKMSRPIKHQNSTTIQNSPEKVIADRYVFVDLGLPSKTSWANKNVGADKITDIGSNETWANSNLLTGESESGLIFVSGRIPSKEEFNELRKLCQWQWTSNGDTSGYRIIGPNGNSIFLPVTSNHGSKKHLIRTGTYTEFVDNSAYWTKSNHETLPNCVWIFSFTKYDKVLEYVNVLSESKKERKYSLRLVNP